jgi:hypothetical protein
MPSNKKEHTMLTPVDFVRQRAAMIEQWGRGDPHLIHQTVGFFARLAGRDHADLASEGRALCEEQRNMLIGSDMYLFTPELVDCALQALKHSIPATISTSTSTRSRSAASSRSQATRASIPRSVARAAARSKAELPDSGVQVIDLRRRTSSSSSEGDTEVFGRTLSQRVIVRGHWRRQACGPNHSERRLTWIDQHLRGPEDAEIKGVHRVYFGHGPR